ncbi:MAG TPA: cytochrome P450 [Verrucomicrobiae bacterium]|nr:cytochrome P450 [Verrucomicrobiae bacterium]
MRPLVPLVSSPSHWLLGPAYHARRDPLRWIPKWLGDHGDLCRIRSLFGQAVVVGAPELARQVLIDRYTRYQQKSRAYAVLRILMGNGLVTSAGDFWRGQRKLVQPAFHRRRLDALGGMMIERVAEMVARLALAARTGETVDLAPILSQLTLEIIARAMFSSDVHGQAADVTRHIATLNEFALHLLRNPWLFLVPRRFPTPFTRRQYDSLQALNRIVHGIIQSRRRNPGAYDDLLQMLLSACEETTGQGMTDAQLRDEVMTIFVAGHETTANAMAWLIYLVSRHPAVEERLQLELELNWPADGLRLEHLGEFRYTRQVIEESLRVYPTIWSIGRFCVEDDELGGYRIPARTNVLIPIFYFHWNPRFWVEPERFDPDRFAPERRPAPDSMIYFPFGAGPRSCVGNHFAFQELMIMTVLLFRHFRFRVAPGASVEPDPLITLRPKYGLRMLLSERRPASTPEIVT